MDADSEPCGVEQASRILSTSRSRPGLLSTHSDQGRLSEWSGLDHLPGSPVSGLSDDHSPFGQLPVSSPLESIWSSSSVSTDSALISDENTQVPSLRLEVPQSVEKLPGYHEPPVALQAQSRSLTSAQSQFLCFYSRLVGS